jgi:hypothetical protein
VLAVDGKTVRRRPPTRRQPSHVVAVFDLTSAAVLAKREIASKGGEVAVVSRLLDRLDLTVVLVTADGCGRPRPGQGRHHRLIARTRSARSVPFRGLTPSSCAASTFLAVIEHGRGRRVHLAGITAHPTGPGSSNRPTTCSWT